MNSQTKEATLRTFVWRAVGSFFLGAVFLSTAFAQQETKLQNDPTYSTRNYKHPNKAAAAKAWESEITLGRQERRQVRMGDYKRSANTEQGSTRLTFTPRRNRNTNPEMVAGYNYKNPRPQVANKESRKPAKPIAIVPAEESEVPTGN